MTLRESLLHAVSGNTLLFLGAGFAYGAENQNGRTFPLGNELCDRLIEDGKIDVSGDLATDIQDLKYISERYLETNPKQDMLRFLQQEFTCKCFTEAQGIIASNKWRRIYTTNYDNIIEFASDVNQMKRESITPETCPSDVLSRNNAVIHMNGYIKNVTADKLDTTFKLLNRSYQKSTIPASDWAISLHNDLANAKCLIFIGYSLDYDLELQQIFAQNTSIKDKCIFITYNPSNRAKRNMEQFGTVENIGVDGFAQQLKKEAASYQAEEDSYQLCCLRQVSEQMTRPAAGIDDAAVTDLFFNGNIRMENIFSVRHNQYIVTRECAGQIIRDITGGFRAVIIASDIGNGKSVLLRDLEVSLSRKGSVYYLDELNSYIQDDMEYISSLRGIKFIVVENYNRIIDSEWVRVLASYQRDDIRFLFSVRTYLNNNLFQRFIDRVGIREDQISIYDINYMSHNEKVAMCNLLDTYSLWGKRAGLNRTQKIKYLTKDCGGEIRALMLDLLKSNDMQKKIKRLTDTLFADADLKEIVLLAFICRIIAIDLKLDDILLLLNKQVRAASILKNDALNEFMDIRKEKIILKSPLVASFILQNYPCGQDVEDLIKKVILVLDRHCSVDQYRNMLRMLISYSNLRMIFNRSGNRYREHFIRIYECGKTLSYHEKNPFFWLQYAIARMDMKDYKTAAIYLENADAYSKAKFDSDSWQINTHKARLLLEQTVEEGSQAEAFQNFETAFHLLHHNKTPDPHYPLRQVSLFKPYYEAFYEAFTDAEKNQFLLWCIEMQKDVNAYLSRPSTKRTQNDKNIRDLRRTERELEEMRKEMAEKG